MIIKTLLLKNKPRMSNKEFNSLQKCWNFFFLSNNMLFKNLNKTRGFCHTANMCRNFIHIHTTADEHIIVIM